ncbi:hypothetical protein SUGI_0214010 [Cryptomeria japonica]|nr:hypothetical protein SUGI_0214010 [Cryptomeria japonica]
MDYDLDDMKMILASCALIICMLWDIAFYVAKDKLNYKISSWVPTNLFVLSSLTIQILNYIDIQKLNVFGASNATDMQVLVDNQMRMDAGRLTMCVFVGCLLPGMATVGSVGRWSSVAALFVSLIFHIATEIYALQNVNDPKLQSESGPWFVSSGLVLLLGASSLLFLLGAVILSGKITRDDRRPDADIFVNGDDQGKALRREAMKSWVAVRAWKTKYFVLSSLFSPGAGVIVTICVVVMAAKVGCRSSLLHHNNGGGNLTFYLQCIFILVGWILMLCRWFKAALYCPNAGTVSLFMGVILSIFLVPSGIVVYLLNPTLVYILLDPEDFSIREFKWRNILTISVPCLVLLLPLCVLLLAIGLVLLFCYICWYFSYLVFSSQFVRRLCQLDKKAASIKDASPEYRSLMYRKEINKDLQRTFLMANKQTFDRINDRMDAAYKNAQRFTVLHSIIGNSGMDQNQRLRRADSKQRWMKTMSNIFSAIADIEIGVDMGDAFKAYRETEDVLKFVDCPDNIVKFAKVERKVKQGLGTSVEEGGERAERQLTIEEYERVNKLVRDLEPQFSIETGSNTVLTSVKECRSKEEVGEMLRTLVGHVTVSCLLEASDVIVKYTRLWAQNVDEGKIERAVEVAGKVLGHLEKLVKDGSAGERGQVPSQSAGEGEDIEAAAG